MTRADRLMGKAWLASWDIWSVEELETPFAGTEPKTPYALSIIWRREATWKEKAVYNLPLKDDKRTSSIRPTLEMFQRQLHRRNLWETGWGAYGLSRARWYYLELNWTVVKELIVSSLECRVIVEDINCDVRLTLYTVSLKSKTVTKMTVDVQPYCATLKFRSFFLFFLFSESMWSKPSAIDWSALPTFSCTHTHARHAAQLTRAPKLTIRSQSSRLSNQRRHQMNVINNKKRMTEHVCVDDIL